MIRAILFINLALAASTNGFQPIASNVIINDSSRRQPPRPGYYSSALRGLHLVAETVSETTTLLTAASTSDFFLHNTDVWVFLAGVFPFAWATVEFWRRIAFGESFGTGTNSVIIGMEDSPADSRGQVTLGRGALIVAYILFAISFGTLGIVLYSVISSAPPPEFLPSSQEVLNTMEM
jgi:hypothetical protein